jgi:uncharacterized protein (DUF433 family)
MSRVEPTQELLERRVYGMGQVDRLLGLSAGTARRWIDGYTRAGVSYDPVVREQPTGVDVVTWGEFVEVRLLSEYRDAGVPLLRLRPVVDSLRQQFGQRYPMAHANVYFEGRSVVAQIQAEVGLERPLQLVEVQRHTGQLQLDLRAQHFVDAVEFESGGDRRVLRLRPPLGGRHVTIDPLRQFGEPAVRSVPTEVIAEQVRAGDRIALIADLYDLTTDEVEAAVRYELSRVPTAA